MSIATLGIQNTALQVKDLILPRMSAIFSLSQSAHTMALRKLCSNSHVCLAPEISPVMLVGSRAREIAWISGYFPCYFLNLPQDDNISEF